MKLLLAGIPVSPSRTTGVTAHGSAVATVLLGAPCCSAIPATRQEVPYLGLVRTRAFADVPSSAGPTGQLSPQVVRPADKPARMRHQHIDLDPQRPRPRGGCG